MIKITIEQVIETKVEAKKQFLTSSKPALDGSGATIFTDSEYGNNRKVAKVETYEVMDVTETQTTRVTLLSQEIVEDHEFDLKRVISAINR